MTRVLLVGTGPLARATARVLTTDRGTTLVGALTLPGDAPATLAVPMLGTSGDTERILRTMHIDRVYLAGEVAQDYGALQRVVDACERFGTPFAVPATPFRHQRSLLVNATPDASGFVHWTNTLERPLPAACKRVLDAVAAGVGLVLLAPLLALTAVAVKVDSHGPVFFRQVRVGRNGKLFEMLKFRSMRPGADRLVDGLRAANEQDGPVFKLTHDPRVTRVGMFIRRFSIDELPQLWNVLVGDMSLVGPRPPIPAEVAQYQPWQRRRLSMRPGITGLWQVSGRNAIKFEQWMYLDMQYVDHWSILQDLRLLWRTLPVVLTGRGAS